MAPKHWALATFFIPIAAALSYGVWLIVSAAGLAQSTRAEEIVRSGALLAASIIFASIPRAWARAVGIGSAFSLLLALAAVLQFEVFR